MSVRSRISIGCPHLHLFVNGSFTPNTCSKVHLYVFDLCSFHSCPKRLVLSGNTHVSLMNAGNRHDEHSKSGSQRIVEDVGELSGPSVDKRLMIFIQHAIYGANDDRGDPSFPMRPPRAHTEVDGDPEHKIGESAPSQNCPSRVSSSETKAGMIPGDCSADGKNKKSRPCKARPDTNAK